jgi:phosphofructokinase
MAHRLRQLRIDGLICIGGDGTLNGLQPLADRLPTVLAPKTIDHDLGLNFPSEPDEYVRVHDGSAKAVELLWEGRNNAVSINTDVCKRIRYLDEAGRPEFPLTLDLHAG